MEYEIESEAVLFDASANPSQLQRRSAREAGKGDRPVQTGELIPEEELAA